MTKQNIVLIDYENIQKINLQLLDQEKFIVYVFIGSNQTKIPKEIVIQAQRFGDKLKWISLDASGKNALDFHIAYYIGKLQSQYENGFYHIISGDTGFDPLIKTLKKEKVFCLREKSIEDIPVLKVKNTTDQHSMIDEIIEKIEKTSKPRTIKTLSNMIHGHFNKELGQEKIDELVKLMEVNGRITIQNNRIEYKKVP